MGQVLLLIHLSANTYSEFILCQEHAGNVKIIKTQPFSHEVSVKSRGDTNRKWQPSKVTAMIKIMCRTLHLDRDLKNLRRWKNQS